MITSLLLASLLSPVAEPVSSIIPPVRQELLVSTAWLAEHLHDPAVVILHLGQDQQEFTQGHIPGARFLSWSQVATERQGIANELPPLAELVRSFRQAGVEKHHRIILYDQGAGLQAARAFVALDYLGLGARSALLNGHWKVWKAENRPVATGLEKISPSRLEPDLNPDVILSLPQIQDLVWQLQNTGHSRTRLLDARPPAQFTGAEPGEGVRRAGHIPGAASLFWMNFVSDEARPLLKSPEALHRLFRQAGVGPGQTVVSYCRTGGQASHAYFISRYLGYPARLYDGSFLEWSSVLENPVVSGTEPVKLP